MADAHYGLPVVTCTGCGASVVRRRDPGVVGWRRGRRVIRSIVAVGVQCLVSVLVLAAAAALIDALAESAYHDHGANPVAVLVLLPHELRPDESGPMVAVLAGFLLMVALFTGMWVRSAMVHLPKWRVWIGVVMMAGLLAAAEGLLSIVWYRIDPDGRPPVDPYASRYLGGTLAAALMYGVLIPVGFPFGRVALAAWRANWKARRSKYRRRRRRLREDR